MVPKQKNNQEINNKKSNKKNSLFEIAYNKAQKGDHLEAVSIFNKILEKNPNNISALRNRGKSKEILGASLLTWHNLSFYMNLVKRARESIISNNFKEFEKNFLKKYNFKSNE